MARLAVVDFFHHSPFKQCLNITELKWPIEYFTVDHGFLYPQAWPGCFGFFFFLFMQDEWEQKKLRSVCILFLHTVSVTMSNEKFRSLRRSRVLWVTRVLGFESVWEQVQSALKEAFEDSVHQRNLKEVYVRRLRCTIRLNQCSLGSTWWQRLHILVMGM